MLDFWMWRRTYRVETRATNYFSCDNTRTPDLRKLSLQIRIAIAKEGVSAR